MYQQCPSQSHPMGMLRKRPNQIPFPYLVRAGIAASPSGHNQTIKTTTDAFTQMQHKYHPHLPEDYECCVPVQIPSMKSLGARVQLKIHPMPRKEQQSPVFFCFEKNMIPTTMILGGKLELPLNKPGVQFTECAERTNWIQMHRGKVFTASFLKAALGW